MCVAAIAWQAHPRWRLIAVGNRDEYHERPSAPLAAWDDGSGIIAGRDLRAGGTWLGVAPGGRFALVTNYRVPGYPLPGMASRGALVTDWLEREALPSPEPRNPFNLLLASADDATFVGNYPEAARERLAPGIHGLSNGAFASPWPKTRRLCAALGAWLEGPGDDITRLFEPLRDTTVPPEFAGETEERLSSVFIADPVYGTRCSTVMAIDAEGHGTITERSFGADSRVMGEVSIAF